jgi:hypothetical protein
VIESGVGSIISKNVAVAILLLASVSVKFTADVPAEGGVPLIWPLAESMVNGAGNPVAAQEYGSAPPMPVIVNEYAEPATPEAKDPVLIRKVGCALASTEKANVKSPSASVQYLSRAILIQRCVYSHRNS